VRFLAARAALNTGQIQQSLDYLTDLDVRLPEIGDFILTLRAQAYRQLHTWAASLEAWKTFLERYDDSPLRKDAAFGVGDAYYALGELDNAQRAYKLAIKLSPKGDAARNARFNLAHIAELKSEWDDAARIYEYFYYHRPSDPLGPVAKARLSTLVKEGLAEPASFDLRLRRIDKLLQRRSLDAAEVGLSKLDNDTIDDAEATQIEFR